MPTVLFLLLGLLSIVNAHYPGYPFQHRNGGKYGNAFPYANYVHGMASLSRPRDRPKEVAVKGVGYGFNNEFNYRQVGERPVHVGNGHFYYLGKFNGEDFFSFFCSCKIFGQNDSCIMSENCDL